MKDINEIEAENLEKLLDVVNQLDPELYYIRLALEETHVNPLIIPRIIRAIYNLAIGTGFGTVNLTMDNGKITSIVVRENDFKGMDDTALTEK